MKGNGKKLPKKKESAECLRNGRFYPGGRDRPPKHRQMSGTPLEDPWRPTHRKDFVSKSFRLEWD